MSNLKDTLTTIAGILGSIGLAISLSTTQLAESGIVLPDIVVTIGIICAVVSAVVIGILQGKNADGSKKTPTQIAGQKK